MGVSIPQVITETKASGAQVIDGSLTIESSKSQFLSRLPGSSGNRKTWTWSCWVKKPQDEGLSDSGVLFEARLDSPGSTDANIFGIRWLTDGKIGVYDTGTFYIQGTREFRDTSAWYHLVLSVDTTQASNNLSLYVNGDLYLQGSYAQNTDTRVNDTCTHRIGARTTLGSQDAHFLSSQLAQTYFIDGQALDASYFGYTDGLTNTWRPKKFSGSFTTTSVLDGTTWSSGTVTGTAANGSGSGGWTQAFDGDTSTLVYPSDNNGSTEIVLPKTIAWTSKIRIYAGQNATSGTNIIANGVNLSALHTWPLSGGWQEVTSSLSSPLASLKLLNVGGQASNIRAVEIDDVVIVDGLNNTGVNSFYLPMDGNSPIGEDKSGIVTINDGRLWSASVSGGIGPYTNGFDGSLSSYMYPRNQSAEGNLVFAGGLPCDAVYCNTYSSSGTEFFTDSASSPTSVNTSSSFAWVELPADATVLNEIKGTGGAGYDAFAIAAFRKNGTILLDGIKGNSWTPVNFGGSVALDNPQVSGAKPILNTDGGGNVARVGVFGSEVGAYYDVTVSNPGSGNKYYFDGVLTPTPTFYRGATYTFDYTAATSHPLYLSALSDGKHNSKAYSVQFDGTGDYLTLAQSNDFDLTGDYTYEAFIYYTDTTNNPTIFDFSAASGNYEGRLQIQAGTLYLYNSGWISKGAISANTWHHIAVTQDFIFVDGVNIGSGTGAISGSNYKVVTIGARTNNGGTSYGDYFTGYISNVRIVNGTALYTENFTVPTTTLTNVTNTKLLCCQDNNATTVVVAPGGITAVGNAAASNTYNPFVYNIDNYFGVDTSTSNVTKQVIPHSAVDTLYYFCNIHSGMGGSANVVTDETKADPYAWKNVLALPLVGSSSDVSNSVNSGSTTKAITSTNAVASSAVSNFYGGSWYFDGSGDTLTIPNNTDFNFGGDDSTIEMWIYPTRISGTQENIMTRGTSGYSGFIMSVTNFLDTVNGSSWGVNITYDNPLIANAWQHIAVCRSGNTWTVYINGIANGSATASGSVQASAQTLTIGQRTGQTDFQGYMSDIHIYKGVAKYTSNFVVPATSPDILPDTPSGVSGSSKLAKVIDGAVSFDGSGDKLTSNSTDFVFGTSSFTVEAFVYKNGTSTKMFFSQTDNDAGGRNGIAIGYQSGALWLLQGNGSAWSVETTAGSIPTDKWVHIAVSRDYSATKTYYFIDGKLVYTYTSNINLSADNNGDISIGSVNTSSYDWDGFISNLRVIKGTALYTTDFTPPTRELTNVTNTKLLCCQSNTQAGAAAVSPNLAAAINDGTVWSDFLSSAAAFNGTHVRVRAFDGNTSTIAGTANNTGYSITGNYNNALEFIPASPIAYSSSIKVRGRNTGQTTMGVKIDTGSGYGSEIALSSDTLQTVVSGSGNLVRMQVVTKTYSGENELGGIAIDDVYLTDPVTVYGNAAATNFNPFNTDINTVRGQETGYPTWNPLSKSTSTLSNGNLTITTDGGSGYPIELVNTYTPVGRGQWYWEFVLSSLSGSNYTLLGMIPSDSPYIQGNSNNFTNAGGEVKGLSVYVGYDGSVAAYSGAATAGSATATAGVGDVVGWAYDAENGTLKCFINGAPQGTQFTNIRTDVGWLFGVTDYDNSATASYTINFGQKPFKFPPPAGFQPLNAANVRPETVIARPDHYVGVVTYKGSGSVNQIISVSGTSLVDGTPNPPTFNPDLIWISDRDTVGGAKWLFDTVRGSNNFLQSNSTGDQGTRTFTINNNGVSIPAGDGSYNDSSNYVAWFWKAGGNKNTFNVDDVGYATAAAAGLTGGSLTITGASVGTKQGFSIITIHRKCNNPRDNIAWTLEGSSFHHR